MKPGKVDEGPFASLHDQRGELHGWVLGTATALGTLFLGGMLHVVAIVTPDDGFAAARAERVKATEERHRIEEIKSHHWRLSRWWGPHALSATTILPSDRPAGHGFVARLQSMPTAPKRCGAAP